MPPTPNSNVVYTDTGLNNLPDGAVFSHVAEILTPFLGLTSTRHRCASQDVVGAVAFAIAAYKALPSALVFTMQCCASGRAMRTLPQIKSEIGSPCETEFCDLFGYDGLNEAFEVENLRGGGLGDLCLEPFKPKKFHAVGLA